MLAERAAPVLAFPHGGRSRTARSTVIRKSEEEREGEKRKIHQICCVKSHKCEAVFRALTVVD